MTSDDEVSDGEGRGLRKLMGYSSNGSSGSDEPPRKLRPGRPSRLHRLRSWLHSRVSSSESSSQESEGNDGLETPPAMLYGPVFKEAHAAIANCPHLRELTIVLHDHGLPRQFKKFVGSLWKSVCGQLRRLDLDMTPAKIGFALEILKSAPSNGKDAHQIRFGNLEELNITLAVTRFRSEDNAQLVLTLLPLLDLLRPTLRSLSIVSPDSTDLTPLFKQMGKFPNLTKFSLALSFNSATMSAPCYLTSFLRAHQDHLEWISFKPYTPYSGFVYADASYMAWLTGQAPHQQFGFPSLQFSSLREIELSYRPSRNSFDGSTTLATVPDLSKLGAKGLREASLIDISFSQQEKLEYLCLFGKLVGETLEVLTLRVDNLTVELIDCLSENFRALKTLTLEYAEIDAMVRSVSSLIYPRCSRWRVPVCRNFGREWLPVHM